MTEEDIRIEPLDAVGLDARLGLCWGHLTGWAELPIVDRSRRWLKQANARFSPTTFVASRGETPAGMIEFLPLSLLPESGLCPCRGGPETYPSVSKAKNLAAAYPGHLFITCLWVLPDHQGHGIGTALLRHLLDSEVARRFEGILVYVSERGESWEEHIHWPSGPMALYVRAGFTLVKPIESPSGHLLRYKRPGA
ncbi:MAG: GNAT family N-acetyltransferase [Anaerolineae bacterium]